MTKAIRSIEPKLSYVDALWEARKWIVADGPGSPRDESRLTVPVEAGFIPWYAQNARRYTLRSAYAYWLTGNTTKLVLRPEEREVPSPELRGEQSLHSSDSERRETIYPPLSRSFYEGVALWA